VPLADGPQAEHESPRSLGQPRLVGVPDDRGIEERRAFEGVFLREVSPDQLLPRLAEHPVGEQVAANRLEPVAKKLLQPLVATVKLGQHRRQQNLDGRVGEFHHPAHDFHGPLPAGRLEGPIEDTRIVGPQQDAGPLDADRFAGDAVHEAAPLTMPSAARARSPPAAAGCPTASISSRASKWASVDSAPWLSFERSSSSPSRQPPVAAS